MVKLFSFQLIRFGGEGGGGIRLFTSPCLPTTTKKDNNLGNITYKEPEKFSFLCKHLQASNCSPFAIINHYSVSLTIT